MEFNPVKVDPAARKKNKGGRPKTKEADKVKLNNVCTRWSDAELKSIDDKAAKKSMTRAGYMRTLILSKDAATPIIEVPQINKETALYIRSGLNNINQMTRHLNAHCNENPAAPAIMLRIKNITAALESLLNSIAGGQ